MKFFYSYTLLSLFLINIFSPLSIFIWFQKNYKYEEENYVINWKIEKIFSQESGIYKLPTKISYFKKTWVINFNAPKDFVVFKFDKTKTDVSDIKVKLIQDWKMKYANIDFDGDERMLLDEFAYSEPIFIEKNLDLSYEIESKSNLALTVYSEIIWINSSNYSESLTIVNFNKVFWNDSWIIKRSYWWADETLRYEDSPTWINIFAKQELESQKPKTARQIKQEQRIVDIRQYLAKNYSLEDTPIASIKSENWHKLVRPIEKTKFVKKIFVHHTAESVANDSRPDAEIMRAMYYYHTITRWWWDIWYNYVVGRDWKIYEWRAWWDYSVAAHNLWNNKSTVGISVMWNFQDSQLNNLQKSWIDKAIWLMSNKYWIDLNKTSISHKECAINETCLLNDYETSNLSGHRDAGATSCPWTNLYSMLWDFREYGKLYSNWLTYVENNNIIPQITSLPKGPSIKIKLSFSWETLEIKSFTPEKMKISIGNRSWVTKLTSLKFVPKWTDKIALVVWKKSLKITNFSISSTVLEIANWSRIPAWDSSRNLNDNKFRWKLTVFNENGKLSVYNELPIEDYLKWLAEISNTENQEKAKTILVAARSYAIWYSKPENRKFPGKIYDWSDDPDVFQKYLGYGYEQRSSNIWRLVDETNAEVIEYNSSLIKPWYFNASNGKTKSSIGYCEERKAQGSLPKTAICVDIPYLQSVVDPSGKSEDKFKWHWVWISGNWAKYFADKGKTYKEIIGYFLKWVKVAKYKY